MPLALFDKIHDDAYLCTRTEPATIEEFVKFGLQPEDYVRYVGLQQRLQGELMICGFPKSKTAMTAEKVSKTTYPALEELISFCKEKRLITTDDRFHDEFYLLGLLDRGDAEYYHGWLQYPKEAAEFRLTVERKLSTWWDEEDAYLTETFGHISFSYDYDPADGACVPFDAPVRIRRCIPETNEVVILKHSETSKLLEVAHEEKKKAEQEIASHLAQMPDEHDVAAVSAGLPWVKRLYELYDRQEIIEGVFEMIEKATTAPDVYKFKESDTLVVFCGADTCKESGHHLSDIRVDFSFYGKPDKQYTLKRCAHCKQFRISLQDLLGMFDSYGVPRGIIVYDDNTSGDFSDFSETSVFYDMGYTVSQSVGLSATRRQDILKRAIETGKASKLQVLNFLRQRMNINGMKSGNEIAFRKWKEDYDFISQLKI